MKTPIAYEGIKTEDNRTILEGATYWDVLPLPIMGFSDPGLYGFRDRVGKIVDLERIDNVIWATLDISVPSGYCLSLDGDSSQIEFPEDYGVRSCVFTKIRVAGGTLIPIESWAWNGT